MANVRHAARLREGAQGWNIWRAENVGVAPDLSDLKLPAGARRFGPDEGGPIDLSRTNLRRAALAGADLRNARLDNADLSGADLSGANLGQVDLTGAQLAGTDLSGAWVGDARGLTQAQVNRAKGNRATVLPKGLVAPPSWLGDAQAPAPEPAALHADEAESGVGAGPDPTAEEAAGKGDSETGRSGKPGKGSDAESDPYSILGVGRKASQTEIRAAYLRLVKELHPDGRAPGADADDDAERLKVINDAYQTLKGADRQAIARQAERRRRGAAAFVAGVVTAMVPLVVAGLFAAKWLGPPSPTITAAVTDPTSRMARDDALDRTGVGAGDSTGGSAEVVQTGAISVHVKETDGGRGRALAAARRQGTRQAWEQLALAYPDDEIAAEVKAAIAAIERAEARRRQEATDWARVENSGDKKELQRFVLAHPESARAVQAREMIAGIERLEVRRRAEELAWAKAEKSGDKQEMKRFVADHPESAYVGRARELIAAIDLAGVRRREAIAWAEAQKIDSRQELERFARTRPHSIYAPEARRRVAVLEAEARRGDAADWDKAVRLHSRAGYAGYVSRNPKGHHVADANRRMADLARAETRPTVEPVKAVAEASAARQRAPEGNQGWQAADEPFVGADGRIRR